MSKRQTRKTVSMKLELYATLERYCREVGVSPTAYVGQAIECRLLDAGVEIMPRDDAIAVLNAKRDDARAVLKEKRDGATKAASGIFTF